MVLKDMLELIASDVSISIELSRMCLYEEMVVGLRLVTMARSKLKPAASFLGCGKIT